MNKHQVPTNGTWLSRISSNANSHTPHPTRTTINSPIIKIITALAIVIGFTLTTPPAPTAAYETEHNGWYAGVVYTCIRSGNTWGFPSSTRRDNIRGWIQDWADHANITLLFQDNTPQVDADCSNEYDIDIALQDNGPAGQHYVGTIFGNPFEGWIRLDKANYLAENYHWTSSAQDCVTGFVAGCKMDARTIITHEFGHILGLDHPAGQVASQCSAGYAANELTQACDLPRDEKMMSFEAGAEFANNELNDVQYGGERHQGYRHTITTDDINGLVSLYGQP